METAQRQARNELMFRAVNDKIKALNGSFESFWGEPALFVCECGDLHCGDQLPVPIADYERIRNERAQFIVKPGHEAPAGLERVVERTEAFVVVEKTTER
jgi:hypothetical protein